MIRIPVAVLIAASILAGCEGRRSLDNPENLDNMPVQDERVEDTAHLQPESAAAPDTAMTTGSSAATEPTSPTATTP